MIKYVREIKCLICVQYESKKLHETIWGHDMNDPFRFAYPDEENLTGDDIPI